VNHWASALAFLALSAVVGTSMLVIARVLQVRAKKTSPLKHQTYECGEEPQGPAWIKFHPRYYVVALVFVLFDVEAAFLFPWAISVGKLGLVAIIDMVIFVAILMLGWAYALKKGALDWH
jgi:NADH:ubiquinone oxidoreductase subunit 3 (subunit A)